MIIALSRVIDDSVGSFSGWAKFPLGRVFGCRGDFAQDEVPYVKSFELQSFIVVLGHLLLILSHSVRSPISDLIQVNHYLIIVALLMEHLLFDASYSHLNRDYCLNAVSEPEWGFSCWDSYCSPVSHKTLGNFSGQAPLVSSNLALMILSSV